MAILINPDGSRETITGSGKKGAITLEEMQAAVGGHCAHTSLGAGGRLPALHRHLDSEEMALYDEEGGPDWKNLPVNPAGSSVVGYEVRGPVLVCQTDSDGEMY